jgi:hypothetical protein
MKKVVLILLILVHIAGDSDGQVIFDESKSDPSFVTFQKELSDAVGKKDLAKLIPLFADTIYESNDGCGWPGCPKSTFFNYYFVGNDPRDWATIKQIQKYGFFVRDTSFSGKPNSEKTFAVPSYFKDFDDDFELVVLGANVNIRKSASLNAEVIYKASNEKFKCDCNILTSTEDTYKWDIDGYDWVQVKLGDGRIGYVAMKLTSENLPKRLVMEKQDGKWHIVAFWAPSGC